MALLWCWVRLILYWAVHKTLLKRRASQAGQKPTKRIHSLFIHFKSTFPSHSKLYNQWSRRYSCMLKTKCVMCSVILSIKHNTEKKKNFLNTIHVCHWLITDSQTHAISEMLLWHVQSDCLKPVLAKKFLYISLLSSL